MEKELTTLFTGRNFIELDTVDSTNTYLSQLISEVNCPEGTVVYAKSQNAGRGQAGQRWESEYGQNILISVLFRPYFLSPRHLSILSQSLALGVYDFLSKYVEEDLSLKWPNDIYANGQKLGGILLENTLSGIRVNSSIFGLGLNINQAIFPDYVPDPVSLRLLTGKLYYVPEMMTELLNSIEQRYLAVQAGKVVRDEYCSRLFQFGKKALYQDDNGQFEGIIRGVDESGRLLMERTNGLTVYDLKQIRYLKN